MKNTYTILVLSFAFNSFLVNAQDTQKWYADDIYYNSNEKEINYLEIFYEDQEKPSLLLVLRVYRTYLP